VSLVEKIIEQMRTQRAGVRFADLKKVCDAWFGKPRQTGSSHAVYKTPWPGDPRVYSKRQRQSQTVSGAASIVGH